MTAKSRVNALGTAGRKDATDNSQDSFIKTFEAPITIVAATSEQDTGITLPAQGIVLSAYVRVETAEATGLTKTVDLGITSNPDAIIDGASVAATGSVGQTAGAGELSSVPCAGSNITYALGSADFAELVATAVVVVLGSDG